jgi:hypothetical protein
MFIQSMLGPCSRLSGISCCVVLDTAINFLRKTGINTIFNLTKLGFIRKFRQKLFHKIDSRSEYVNLVRIFRDPFVRAKALVSARSA